MRANVLTLSVIIMMLFFTVSLFLIPMTPEYGYYTAFAKYMAQGMVPYRDFHMIEMPVGIGLYSLIYKLTGVEASTNFSVIPFVIINAVNLLLMIRLMLRMNINKNFVIIGTVFYFLLCYSSDALHMNMEILAGTFFLGACLAVLEKRRVFTMLAALLFAVAVVCKAQIIAMFPALVLIAATEKSKSGFNVKQCCLLIGSTLLFILAGYVIVALSCDNFHWIEDITWSVEGHHSNTFNRIKNIISYIVIQSARCGIAFLFITPFIYKSLHSDGRRMAVIALAATACYFALFYIKVEVVQGIFFYPFVTIALMHILQAISKKTIVAIIATVMMTPPVALSAREFMKFGNGELKKIYNEEMGYIKEILKKPGKAVMLIYTDKEFYIGPQIFSEYTHVQPVKIENGALGYNFVENVADNFIANIEKADYIIINDAAFMEMISGRYVDIFGEKIEKMKSSGTQSIMIYEK